jgi:hypothetical protein
MECHRADCSGRARIRETRAPYRQFCDTLCQRHYWLGATPRLDNGEEGERCTLRLGETELEALFTVAVVLDLPERALLDGTDEALGLARGTLCWPELRLAYRFPAQYDWLHWLDFAPPLSQEDGSTDVKVALRLGEAEEVMVSHRLLLSAALRMATAYAPHELGREFILLVSAVHGVVGYDEVTQWDQDKQHFYYADVKSLLAHLMYLHAQEAADRVAHTVRALMRRDKRRPLRVTSVQDYVADALRPLGGMGRARTIPSTGKERQLVFALPGLQEEDWRRRLDEYIALQDYTPGSGMLKNARYVTVVAREPDGRLLGYVTCALYAADRDAPSPEKMGVDAWHSAEMRRFARARNDDVYDLFLIEGLSVDRQWRGGRQDSVAVLLVFHALYFALRCSADCGLMRVSCESAARTTALIMRQFGGVHRNPRTAVRWMEARQENGESCAGDLAAFAAEYEDSAPLLVGSEEEQVAALRKQLLVPQSVLGKRWEAPMRAMTDSLAAKGTDTFLYLGPENRRLHEEMARVERLLTEQGHKQTRENDAADEDLQGAERRKRVKATGAPLTTLSLGALDRFALK